MAVDLDGHIHRVNVTASLYHAMGTVSFDEIAGRGHVLEYALHADYALIKADRADRWGNLTYRKTARNFGPIMAAAAKCTVAQVRETVELGQLDPEAVVTPGIFVKRVVKLAPHGLTVGKAA